MCRPAKKVKIEQMLEIINSNFSKFKDPRSRETEIKLDDFLKTAYSIFALKYPSLLSFEKDYKKDPLIFKNVKALFDIEKIPSDTHMRDVLDLVDSNQYRKIFKELFAMIQKTKVLDRYKFIEINGDAHYLVALDGTGYFASNKVSCGCCTVYHEKNDKKANRFGHQVLGASLVHPDRKEVFSFCPEPIIKQDGANKYDCEQNAFKRWIKDFRREHPKLKIVLLLDALYANTPVIKLLQKNDIRYIITIQDGKKTLYRELRSEKRQGYLGTTSDNYQIGEKVIKDVSKIYEFSTELRLGQDKDSAEINYISLEEEIKWVGKKDEEKVEKKNFKWITDIWPSQKNIRTLTQGGRTRWKIENETFNTLKNQGYHLEHNYGHGEKNLSINFVRTMFLSFLVDQIQTASCQKFRKAINSCYSKAKFWSRVASCIEWVDSSTWDEFYDKLIMKGSKNTS